MSVVDLAEVGRKTAGPQRPVVENGGGWHRGWVPRSTSQVTLGSVVVGRRGVAGLLLHSEGRVRKGSVLRWTREASVDSAEVGRKRAAVKLACRRVRSGGGLTKGWALQWRGQASGGSVAVGSGIAGVLLQSWDGSGRWSRKHLAHRSG